MGVKADLIRAKQGDCMLLRYGNGERTMVLVDGGAPKAFQEYLAPRLAQLRAERDEGGAEATAPIELAAVMISHIDQDHIDGVNDLLREIELAETAGKAAPYDVKRLLHNGFRELAAADEPDVAGLAAAVEAKGPTDDAEMVVASAREGAKTVAMAKTLGIPVNKASQAGDLLLDGTSLDLDDGLSLKFLGPTKEQVEALRKEWADKVGVDEDDLVPASVKETVPNLSSLIVLAEVGGKRILLTGDALGGHVYAGLERANLLDSSGKAHFDLLKVPHHGSFQSISEPTDFLEKITADNYTISGDGTSGNPEVDTLRAIAKARGGDAYDIWLTYRKGKGTLLEDTAAFEQELAHGNGNAKLHFPANGDVSTTVDLG